MSKITDYWNQNMDLSRSLAVISLIIVMLLSIPLVYLLIRTATIGFDVFDVLISPKNLSILINSIMLAVLVTTFATLIAVPLAFFTVRTDLPFKRFIGTIAALPLVIPSYVGSFVIISAIGPKGSILHNFLKPLGVDSLPSIYGLDGAVLALTLFTYPYIYLTVRSSLQNLDPSLEEAARNMGYSQWKTFMKVTLPHIKPAIASGGLLVALYSLSDFGTPSLMRFNSFTRAIFIQYQSSFDRTTAAVLALLLVLLAIVILSIDLKFRKNLKYYSVNATTKRPLPTIELKKWKIPALIYTLLIIFFALIMPLIVISYWIFRGTFDSGLITDIFDLVVNSVYVSGLTAIAAIIAALPIAIYAIRYPKRLSSLFERITYLGSGLPGIVVALSLVFFGANFAIGLYQTTAMLIFAYVVLFLPKAVGSISTSLLQVNPALEEAARSLGHSPTKTLQKITIPLIRPGIVNGIALVFLTTMKELPATLILSPIGFQTLATRIWAATDDAFYTEAAILAILMVLVSGISTYLILRQEKKSY